LHYSYKDIIEAYRGVGVESGRVVYVTGSFGRPGIYQFPQKNRLLDAHLTAIQEILGPDGTLMVPTHSRSLCNTKKPFDLSSTPSETGPFTEYVRIQNESVRQFHPFSSTTALGKDAEELCLHTSMHVYGAESPFQRMIDCDALYVSVGQDMAQSISLVHHIEFVMGVPYRYVKEFRHPCLIDDEVEDREFYLHVIRKDLDIRRDKNRKIMSIYKKNGDLHRAPLGRSFIEAVSSEKFYKIITKEFSKNIYLWLESDPTNRTYLL